MTYWPFASPSVFSATKYTDSDRVHVSHDGHESPSQARRSGATPDRRAGDAENHAQKNDALNGEREHRGSTGEVEKAKEGRQNEQDHGIAPIPEDDISAEVIAARGTRSGHMFATVTRTTLSIWQTKPTVILVSVLRSARSLKTYGANVDVLFRPDSQLIVVQTALNYLITYTLATDPTSRVYKTQLANNGGTHARRHSTTGGFKNQRQHDVNAAPGEGNGISELSIQFRMVIRIDGGIAKALALDEDLVIATKKGAAMAAVQCIRYTPDRNGSQTSSEVLNRMAWLEDKESLVDIIYDRPMNIAIWITGDGRAYAVQRLPGNTMHEGTSHPRLFNGYGFHHPETGAQYGVKAAINARFSLLAVGCANGEIYVYTARDYTGNIPLSHKLSPNTSNPGDLTVLAYSPDGYCLFAGYERGWAMWSVYGMPLATSFTAERDLSSTNGEGWLLGIRDAFWIGGGCELALLPIADNRIFLLEMARSGITGCFSSANISRSLLQTSSGFMIYRGYELPDMTTISSDVSLWHHVQVPGHYLVDQWPIRSAVISNDGRYVAIAGRRGLAHYSVNSGRWKIFDDPFVENAFTVRGGMCWFQHVLIAAVEAQDSYQIRIYSREQALGESHVMHTQTLPAPIVLIAPSGEDSLLVYTYENILYHYIIDVKGSKVGLVQVGQIALHGIIRAPPRVRALSWILPEHQIQHGDPSQDVAVATILFLVDGKLVLLQPTTTENGELKYEMRIIAQNVETYALMRDHPAFALDLQEDPLPPSPYPGRMLDAGLAINGTHGHDLRDSLWYFDGKDMRCWIDMADVLASASVEMGRDLPSPVKIPVDFYPLASIINKGIVFGVESDLVQRRDIGFAHMRFTTRTHLFLPPLLRHHLTQYNSPAALHLSSSYSHLSYFPHALEILLHETLDDEVDNPPVNPESALLPSVLSFLSSFPEYLDIVVQCTRKTELRSWRTLFRYLPRPEELFEEALRRGNLKTAGGYLLVLQAFDELRSSGDQVVRLLRRAREEEEWGLCKELARFLMALDESGDTLRRTLGQVGLRSPRMDGAESEGDPFDGTRLGVPGQGGRPRMNGSGSGRGSGLGLGLGLGIAEGTESEGESSVSGKSPTSSVKEEEDYFGRACS